jgi:xylan 1,4-beta-xylosidase
MKNRAPLPGGLFAANASVVGYPQRIWRGGTARLIEAPLTRRGDYYYLMVAEGGTGYAACGHHGARKQVAGPYEGAPQTPSSPPGRRTLTRATTQAISNTLFNPQTYLQKAGHGAMSRPQRAKSG